jgi:hypothetical protein
MYQGTCILFFVFLYKRVFCGIIQLQVELSIKEKSAPQTITTQVLLLYHALKFISNGKAVEIYVTACKRLLSGASLQLWRHAWQIRGCTRFVGNILAVKPRFCSNLGFIAATQFEK